jgi:hypothetical protein
VRGSATPTRAHLIIKQASNVHLNGVVKLPFNTKLASTSHPKGVIMRALGGCELVIQIAGLCGVVRCGVGPVRLRLAKRSGRACV